MFGITWVWMEQGEISTEDLQVDPAQTLYEYFHEQLMSDSFSIEEHQFLTKTYIEFLHVKFENLPESMLNSEGFLELYFFEKEDAQTELETAQNRLEELEQNLNRFREIEQDLTSLSEKAKAAPLDELIQIANSLDKIEGKLSDEMLTKTSQPEPLDTEYHQSPEEHGSVFNISEPPSMEVSKPVQESPRQFSFFKEKSSVVEYPFKYRRVVSCRKNVRIGFL